MASGSWKTRPVAFGSRYKGRHVGTFGHAGCFSFHPRKAITTGEGGMITTQDDALAERLRRLRDHGAAMSDLQRHMGARPYLLADHPDAGYNQRMTDLQAALGSAQMDRARRHHRGAPAIGRDLRRGLCRPAVAEDASPSWTGLEHGYQSYPCLFQPEPITPDSIPRINQQRNAWMDGCSRRASPPARPRTRCTCWPSTGEKYGLQPEDFPDAYAANDCSISLPLFHGMSEANRRM